MGPLRRPSTVSRSSSSAVRTARTVRRPYGRNAGAAIAIRCWAVLKGSMQRRPWPIHYWSCQIRASAVLPRGRQDHGVRYGRRLRHYRATANFTRDLIATRGLRCPAVLGLARPSGIAADALVRSNAYQVLRYASNAIIGIRVVTFSV